jgi:hypothetical protein
VVEDLGMARSYRPVVRDQPFLLPPDMREWLPADHLVWFVLEIVDRLDRSAFHARHRNVGVGRGSPETVETLVMRILLWPALSFAL